MAAIIGVYSWQRSQEKNSLTNAGIVSVGHGEDLYQSSWYDQSTQGDRYGGGPGNPYGPNAQLNPNIVNPIVSTGPTQSWVQPQASTNPFAPPVPSGQQATTRAGQTTPMVPVEVPDPDLFL
jgi:hypothetical protein